MHNTVSKYAQRFENSQKLLCPFSASSYRRGGGDRSSLLDKNEYIQVLEEQCAAFPQLISCFFTPSPTLISSRTGPAGDRNSEIF